MRYKITCNGFPTVTISKMAVGEKVYAKRNCCIASSPIGETGLMRRRIMATELEGEDYSHEIKPTALSQLWSDFRLDVKQTTDRQRIGERSYVLYEAKADEQKVTFRSCFPGTIMAWNAKKLASGECYVRPGTAAKSIFNERENEKPHGVLLAVMHSFLAASLKVSAKVFHTKDVNVMKFSDTGDSFQRFKGDGYVFLEAHGDLQEIPLYPGEAVDVFPGYLLAFTEGMTLKMKPAGDATLRNEENNDYVINLTAPDIGGFVYTHSVKPRDFLERMNH